MDACESIHTLPDIKLSVIEYSEDEHNSKHGIKLYSKKGDSSSIALDDGDLPSEDKVSKKKKGLPKTPDAKAINYYDITCRDNGCGIHPDSVGNMLGRVLSGSKHGVRQTRGKFGLGAKMAVSICLHVSIFCYHNFFRYTSIAHLVQEIIGTSDKSAHR